MEVEPAPGPMRQLLANSTTEGITLFQDRAQMVRSLGIKALQEGENELVLTNVPNGVEEDSFLARIIPRAQNDVHARVVELNLQTRKYKVEEGGDAQLGDAQKREQERAKKVAEKQQEILSLERKLRRLEVRHCLIVLSLSMLLFCHL